MNSKAQMPTNKQYSLGISPCPNDTFMFHHLLYRSQWATQNKVDLTIADVEELNKLCLQEHLQFSKVSFHVLGKVREKYWLLNSGSALGRGCGPLVISKKPLKNLSGKVIGIPGMNTTAYLLLKCFAPDDIQIKEMLFSEIMPAIERGELDAGLIIHESRFTYKELGLSLIVDLGEWWESVSGLPIPLGGIIASRKLNTEVIKDFDIYLKESVQQAHQSDWENDHQLTQFILKHSHEISPNVLQAHIKTYVNEESIVLSDEGQKGIVELFKIAEKRNFIPTCNLPLMAPK
jgi:1,4-dihydroxy-6-naphthoate synthase